MNKTKLSVIIIVFLLIIAVGKSLYKDAKEFVDTKNQNLYEMCEEVSKMGNPLKYGKTKQDQKQDCFNAFNLNP